MTIKQEAVIAISLIGIGASIPVILSKFFRKYEPEQVWKPPKEKEDEPREKVVTRELTTKPTPDKQQQHFQELPCGKHALQLYSFGTPNGVKVTILLEELSLKHGIEYDAFPIDITKNEQFNPHFTQINPNSKIPALLHYVKGIGAPPVRVFESAAILLYLCEKLDKNYDFFPAYDPMRAECLSWLCFAQSADVLLEEGFGYFFHHAPVKLKGPIDKFAMDITKQLSVLDTHLGSLEEEGGGGPYLCGKKCTIADYACWPWYGNLVLGMGWLERAAEFLQVGKYKHVIAWAERMLERKGVRRGRMVNRFWGKEEEQLHERHSSQDFIHRKQEVGNTGEALSYPEKELLKDFP